jgi:hypothetical protein
MCIYAPLRDCQGITTYPQMLYYFEHGGKERLFLVVAGQSPVVGFALTPSPAVYDSLLVPLE